METKELERKMNNTAVGFDKSIRDLKRAGSKLDKAMKSYEECIVAMQELSGEDMQTYIDQMQGAKILVESLKLL